MREEEEETDRVVKQIPLVIPHQFISQEVNMKGLMWRDTRNFCFQISHVS